MALFVAWYNFCRIHKTLRVTPAIEAGLTDHIWTVSELNLSNMKSEHYPSSAIFAGPVRLAPFWNTDTTTLTQGIRPKPTRA